ncbi:hypothetical protein GCM10023149_11500 [Mucilaginibacter gynuensis]|uniref:DUF4199 domain-containing protein n=1 Tax=Mucilaginibacter gynuensis TaxID=1302236 RepID=A0ABP8G0Z4_9SPHI
MDIEENKAAADKALQQSIRKAAIPSGVLLGVILLVLGIFSFYFVVSIASSFWLIVSGPLLFGILVPLVIAVFFVLDLRKKIGGFWTLKQATSGIFILFIVGNIVSTIGRDLLFAKVIEPQMVEKMQNTMVNATTKFMEDQNVEQAEIDKKIAEVEKGFDAQKDAGVAKYIQGVVISIIMTFVLALIFAAIFKREPPITLQFDEAPEPQRY